MPDVANIYLDGTYANQNRHFGDDNACWKAGHIHSIVVDHKLAPKTVCEVGCGGGGILVELEKLMPDVESFRGIEPMPEAFAVAKTRIGGRLDFVHGTLDDHDGGLFDLVLCIDVFEHVEDYIGFLRQLRTIGRNFVFHIPLDMNAQMVFRGKPIKMVRDQVGHIHYFSKDTALATLEDAGYKVTDYRYTDGANHEIRHWRARLLKFPRTILHRIAPDFTSRFLGGYPLLVLAERDLD